MKLSATQRLALFHYRGTGRYVGKDAIWKTRNYLKLDIRFATMMSLRNKGLLEHQCGAEWYLTEEGREYLRTNDLPERNA